MKSPIQLIAYAPESAPRRSARWTRLPKSRTCDSAYLPFPLYGAISQWTWRFLTYRMTQAGHWLLGITLLFTSTGSNSLDAQFYVPFNYLFGVWAVALLCVPLCKPRVTLSAHHDDRIGTGETLSIEVEVRQGRRLAFAPLTIVPHCLPPGLEAAPVEGAALPPLGKGQTARVRVPLRCARRGVHAWRGFRVETDFPFGLLRAYRTHLQPHQVLVYPQFTRLARLRIPTGLRHHPGGVALASDLGEAFEYVGNREYREGDNIRNMDWRATARLLTPIVREYREEYFMRVGVILDTHVPEGAKPADLDNFERAVSVCAAVSDYMARSDYIVDIFAAGPNLYHLTAGRSLAYLDQILDILACVEDNPEEPFSVLEPELLHYLSRITTILCVFMDWNETRRDFVDRLRREGAGVKVIVVRDSGCTLDPYEADLSQPFSVISAADFSAGVEEL